MVITYAKLWKLLIDQKMKKKDLQAKAGISASTIAKLGRDEHVSTAILQKICIGVRRVRYHELRYRRNVK